MGLYSGMLVSTVKNFNFIDLKFFSIEINDVVFCKRLEVTSPNACKMKQNMEVCHEVKSTNKFQIQITYFLCCSRIVISTCYELVKSAKAKHE